MNGYKSLFFFRTFLINPHIYDQILYFKPTIYCCGLLTEQKQFQNSLFNALGLAFLSSSLTSIIILLFKYEDELEAFCPHVDTWFSAKHDVQGSSEALKTAIDAYKFLPLFLLLAYTAFLVERWRSFLVTCHSIQGSIHSIGELYLALKGLLMLCVYLVHLSAAESKSCMLLLTCFLALTILNRMISLASNISNLTTTGLFCGSTPDVPVTKSSKKKLYKIYRYLNLIHALCLKSFSLSLYDMKIETDYVHKLGLLTRDEAILLSSMENKARDGTLTLLAHMIGQLLTESTTTDMSSQRMILNEEICTLRGNCARLHDLFVRDNPNEYTMFMGVLTFTYGCLVVLGCPILLMLYDDSSFWWRCVMYNRVYSLGYFLCN